MVFIWNFLNSSIIFENNYDINLENYFTKHYTFLVNQIILS